MTDFIKIVGPQFTVNATANTVSNAAFLRVLNMDPGFITLTIANNGVNVGTITIGSNNGEYLRKYPLDTVVANNNSNVVATPVAIAG